MTTTGDRKVRLTEREREGNVCQRWMALLEEEKDCIRTAVTTVDVKKKGDHASLRQTTILLLGRFNRSIDQATTTISPGCPIASNTVLPGRFRGEEKKY